MCIVCLAFLCYLKRTSYPVRASFGELEFTSCEINHLHIGAKPIKRKNVWNSIQIANKRKTKMCAHTPIMWAHLFAYTIHPVLALPCPTPRTVPGVMGVLNKYSWMNDFGSTQSKEACGKKSSKYEAFFFSKWSIRNLTGSDSQPRKILSPRGWLAVPGDIFVYHSWGGPTGTSWGEARGAPKHPPKHRTAPLPQTENHLVQNVSAEIEKPWDQSRFY